LRLVRAEWAKARVKSVSKITSLGATTCGERATDLRAGIHRVLNIATIMVHRNKNVAMQNK
jgi:hypothetical protein